MKMFALKLIKLSPHIFRPNNYRLLHRTSSYSSPIDEFFESKEKLSEHEIRTGRSWRLEELRLKSQTDLHKLWYVLLKERNMLLTMEEAANKESELFPNPERIDKIDESMENLQTIIRERNAAYLSLEYGTDGQAPKRSVTSMTGFRQSKESQEHMEPAHMHPNGKEYEKPYLDRDQYEFQKLWTEKEWWKKFYERDDEKRKKKQHKYLHRW